LSAPPAARETQEENVFCAACHKALGEFRFVREEVLESATWHELVAERVTLFIGKPYFLAAHAAWFLLWVALNTGMFALVRRFDSYPYSLLGILLSVEAIFITGFLLISQNRQSAFADKRAELDYEVNVRTYRRLNDIEEMQKRFCLTWKQRQTAKTAGRKVGHEQSENRGRSGDSAGRSGDSAAVAALVSVGGPGDRRGSRGACRLQ
jgi:uncharacterized membrane protein